MQKQCNKCKRILPIESFYTSKIIKDGHMGTCKKCWCEICRTKRIKYKTYYTEYEHKRAQNDERKEIARVLSKNYRIKFPERKNAQQIAERAIKKSVIVKPKTCCICGMETKLYAHHPNYNEPLNVIFLCCSCHNKIHHKPY